VNEFQESLTKCSHRRNVVLEAGGVTTSDRYRAQYFNASGDNEK